MATLEKIRGNAKLLVIAIGVALFAFIIGDLLQSGSTFFRQSQEQVIKIDGKSVDIRVFQEKMDEMSEVYKMQTRQNSVPEEIMFQLRDNVYSNFVRTQLLEEASEAVGLDVCVEELGDMIYGDHISPAIMQLPMFQNPQTGSFDRNILIQFLQTIEGSDFSSYSDQERDQLEQAKKYWLFWEQNIKSQRLEAKYNKLISTAIVSNSLDAKAAFDDSQTNVDFDYVALPFSLIADDQISVSDADVKKLYDKRKKQTEQKAVKVISFISVDIVPSQIDFAAVAKQMSELKPSFMEATSIADVKDLVNINSDQEFEDVFVSLSRLSPAQKLFVEKENIQFGDVEEPFLLGSNYQMQKFLGKTVAPDSFKVYQITLPNMEEVALKNLSDSIISEMKVRGFEAVAQDLTSGQSNGEMGWQTEQGLMQGADITFKDAVLAAKLGDFHVIESEFGKHILLVTERTSPIAKYKIATIDMSVSPSSDTYKVLYNDLNRYVAENHNLEAFRASAAAAGYFCQPEFRLNETDFSLGMVQSARPVIRWAFHQEVGDISEIFECQDKFVVAVVEKSIKEGFIPLEDMADNLKREISNERKAEKILADLDAKKYASLDQVASHANGIVQSVKFVNFATPSITGLGFEPVINQIAPSTEVGKLSSPLKGNNGVYVLKVTDLHKGEGTYNAEQQKQMLNASLSQRIEYRILPSMIKSSKVEDNRINFF